MHYNLEERLKMSYSRMDDIFLKFVNVYIKQKKFGTPPEIFYEIDITKKDQEKFKKDHPSFSKEDPESNMGGQIYWDADVYVNAERADLFGEDVKGMHRDVVLKEKVLNSIAEFRRFMLEYPLRVFYSMDGEKKHQMWSQSLFSIRSSVIHLVQTRFCSFHGMAVYVETEAFEDAIKRRFAVEKEDPLSDEEILRSDKNAYCMHALFGLFKYKDVFERFSDGSSYTEDGEVLEYLKKEYGISQYNFGRFILPSLKALRA
ncbi:hypothetical protein UFOVP1597_25 [uncultured Caudovirales phage]|uniref:Uncharacterized protein n=1 Tax=uncultured Caudovirales phage TaxID=2100421 RepID=A0A6J5STF2_9CAUD|nr:hypothetical protein UFOVP1597_25 [uncultured Caudovirales phage]